MKHKRMVAVIFDQEGWSFWNISQQVKRHLSDEFDVCAMSHHKLDKKFILEADAIISLWYGTVCMLHQGTSHWASWQDRIVSPQCKHIACCFDEVLRWNDKAGWNIEETITFAIQHSNAFLCSSDGMARRMFPYFPQPKHLGTCKDGVDLSLFPHHPYRSLAINAGDPVGDLYDDSTPLRIGWVGNTEVFGDLKGISLIHEACDGLDGVRFVHQDKSEHGLVPHDEMHKFYGMVDVLVCMSSCEGTPNPIIEASATGRAWISPDVGIVSELNQDAMSLDCSAPPGLIIPRQDNVLREAIKKLRDNRHMLETMGAVGRHVIEQRWQWKDKAEQYRDALHAVGVRGDEDLKRTVHRQKKGTPPQQNMPGVDVRPVVTAVVEPVPIVREKLEIAHVVEVEPHPPIVITKKVETIVTQKEAIIIVSDPSLVECWRISQLKRKGAKVTLSFVITKQNMYKIPKFIELSDEFDCDCELNSITMNGDREDFLKQAMLLDHVENIPWIQKFQKHPAAHRVTAWPRLIKRIDLERDIS